MAASSSTEPSERPYQTFCQSAIRSLESALQVVGPLVADDQALGLPHHVELAVGLDLADQHRLGDVVVRHHLEMPPVRFGTFDADDGVDHRRDRWCRPSRPPSPTC
jgi:hypothetical protein